MRFGPVLSGFEFLDLVFHYDGTLAENVRGCRETPWQTGGVVRGFKIFSEILVILILLISSIFRAVLNLVHRGCFL